MEQADEHRKRLMTDEDVAAIVAGLRSADSHCRYSVTPEEMSRLMANVSRWNDILDSGSKTAGTTLIVILITGLTGLLVAGFWSRIKGLGG